MTDGSRLITHDSSEVKRKLKNHEKQKQKNKTNLCTTHLQHLEEHTEAKIF